MNGNFAKWHGLRAALTIVCAVLISRFDFRISSRFSRRFFVFLVILLNFGIQSAGIKMYEEDDDEMQYEEGENDEILPEQWQVGRN